MSALPDAGTEPRQRDLANLLREAGAALVLAEVRVDLVLAIEEALGERVARPARATDESPEERRCADMARVAAALDAAGRPLLSKEIAAVAWPGLGVWRCRGYLATFLSRGWIEHGGYDGQANRYVIGGKKDWQRRPDPDVASLRAELAEAQRRLEQAKQARARR